MQALLWPIVSWLLREVVVRFVAVAVVFELLVILVPKAIAIVSPWAGTGGLTSAFAGLPAGVWWGLDMLAVGYGIPLVISAYVARFLIRRIPLIG